MVADGKCNPAFVAADLLSQAEHDRLASAVLVTDSRQLAEAVNDELEKQIPLLSRCDIARESIDNNGKIIIVGSIDEGIEIANEYAPEHLIIETEDYMDVAERIVNAGSVFLGSLSPESAGDYASGTNHTLPTSGTARFSSPLSVDDFIKKSQFTYYTETAYRQCAEAVDLFARQEGLEGHAKSAMIRIED